MKRILTLLCGLLLALPVALRGAPKTAAPPTAPCSYLIVIQTSSSMSKQAGSIQKTVYNMVLTGVYGNMKPGERIVIWTFNDKVHADQFLPMAWAPEMNRSTAMGVAERLSKVRFEKRSNIDLVVKELNKLVKAIDKLNVIIVSDGGDPLVGTPFDRNLNLFYGKHYDEFQKTGVPFVTTLAARGGEFQAWSVNAGGDRVFIPPVDEPPKEPKTGAPDAGKNPAPPSPPPGKQPPTTRAPTSPSESKPKTEAKATTPVATPKTTSVRTNADEAKKTAPLPTKAPAPTAPVVKAPAPKADAPKPPAPQPVILKPETVRVSAPALQTTAALEVKPVPPPPPAPAPEIVVPKPQPPTVATIKGSTESPGPLTTVAAQSAAPPPAPAKPVEVKLEPLKPEPVTTTAPPDASPSATIATTLAPAPAIAPLSTLTPVPAPSSNPDKSTPQTNEVAAFGTSGSTPTRAQTAVVVPDSTRWSFFAAALGLLVVAGALGYVLVRSRHKPQPSLISRSMNRGGK